MAIAVVAAGRWCRPRRPAATASVISPTGSSAVACAAAGRSQSPPRVARNARSASVSRWASASSMAGQQRRRGRVVATALDGEGPLADLGKHDVDGQGLPDLGLDAEANDRCRGHDDGVETARLRQAGGDVAAELGEHEVGPQGGQLGSDGGSSRWRPTPLRRQIGEAGADQGVAGSARSGTHGQHQAGLGDRGQVLHRVHGDVGTAVEHGALHLGDEHALAAHGMDGDVETLVAGGGHDHRLDLRRRGASRSSATRSVCHRASGLARVAARRRVTLSCGSSPPIRRGRSSQRLGPDADGSQVEQLAECVGQTLAAWRAARPGSAGRWARGAACRAGPA